MEKGNVRRYLMEYCFTQKYYSLGVFCFRNRERIITAQHTLEAEDDQDAIIEAKNHVVAMRKMSIRTGDYAYDYKILSLFALRDITDLLKHTPTHK